MGGGTERDSSDSWLSILSKILNDINVCTHTNTLGELIRKVGPPVEMHKHRLIQYLPLSGQKTKRWPRYMESQEYPEGLCIVH
jgi:hypothetical protein